MPTLIFIFVIVMALIIYSTYNSKKAKKQREATIERRREYLQNRFSNANTIVNNGIHLFFIDHTRQFFGLDETGKTYSFDGLLSISKYADGISFMHNDSISLCVGKDITHQNTTIALSPFYINAIYNEMMPILRKNLYSELEKYGITPTHEYEHDGEIFGCDINTKQFYCVCGATRVHDFSELNRVTIDDLSHNSLCSANYEVSVYLKHEDSSQDQYPEYTLYFNAKDATYNNILAMFKGIRNRQ